jgi:hypothetical protein
MPQTFVVFGHCTGDKYFCMHRLSRMLFEKQAFNDSICLFNESLPESPAGRLILVSLNFKRKNIQEEILEL